MTRRKLAIVLLSVAALAASLGLWLTLRGKCGGDVACIRAAYQRRLTDLDKVFKDIASRGPF